MSAGELGEALRDVKRAETALVAVKSRLLDAAETAEFATTDEAVERPPGPRPTSASPARPPS